VRAFVGLARTIYVRCIHGIFGRNITEYTVYGHIRCICIYDSGQSCAFGLFCELSVGERCLPLRLSPSPRTTHQQQHLAPSSRGTEPERGRAGRPGQERACCVRVVPKNPSFKDEAPFPYKNTPPPA